MTTNTSARPPARSARRSLATPAATWTLIVGTLAALSLWQSPQAAPPVTTLALLWAIGLGGLVLYHRHREARPWAEGEIAAQLQRAHELLQQERAIFSGGPVVVFRRQRSPDWAITYVSPNITAILGYGVEELVHGQAAYADLIHPDDLARFSAEVSAQNEGRHQRFEHAPYRLVHKDGSTVWVLDHTVIVRDESGAPTHYQGYVVDITPWKQADEALRASEKRYRQMFETNQAVKLIINPADGRIVEANEAATRFYGYDLAALTTMGITDINCLTPEAVREEMERASREDRLFFDFQHRLASGEVRHVEVYSGPLHMPQGDLLYSIIHDVTERHRAEEDMARALEQLRALIANIQMGILVENAERRIINTNQAFCDLFGIPAPEVILGADCAAAARGGALLFADPEQFVARVEAILAGGAVVVGEELHTRDGRTFERDYVPVFLRGAFIVNMWIYRDITRRKLLEEQLLKQERLAAVGQLAAGVAHDFNNILTSILGYAELMRLEPDLPPDLQGDLEQICASSQRAAHLVRQLLDFGRKSIRHPRHLALDDLTAEVVRFLGRTIPERIKISLSVAPGNYMVEADPAQLQQMITNLVVNARDAMPAGGLLHVELGHTLSDAHEELCTTCGKPISGAWVRLSITDSGSGIAPEALPHIFEPFFTTKEVGEGNGLGLSQVFGIISQHAGHISVRTQMGEGTTMNVYLPPVTAHGPEEGAPPPPVMVLGRNQTVLLVEDEAPVLATLQAMLERLQYRVLTADSGRAAVTIYQERRDEIALVLSDMVMPDMDGATLFRALRAQDAGLSMVLMSGYPLNNEGAALMELGALAWLEKPISFQQLSQAVGAAVAERGAR